MKASRAKKNNFFSLFFPVAMNCLVLPYCLVRLRLVSGWFLASAVIEFREHLVSWRVFSLPTLGR